MKLNTNSNIYTFVYMTVVVIIVAVLLAVVSQALSARHSLRNSRPISCSTSRNRFSVRSKWTTRTLTLLRSITRSYRTR